MQESSVFDKLVENLSTEERKELLDRIKLKASFSSEPLGGGFPEDETYDFNQIYYELPWWQKIFIFLKALFTTEMKEQIIEELVLDKLAKSIERKNPGLISYRNGEFLPNFYLEIKNLADSIAVFDKPLTAALGSYKTDFIAFLGGWTLPLVQDRFLLETDPEKVAYERSLSDPFDVKREIEFRVEDIFHDISEEDRRVMYQDSRSLHCLYTLVNFSFEKIFNGFKPTGKSEPEPCGLAELRKPLMSLYDILSSFVIPPDERPLKAVFLFALKNDIENNNTELEEKIDGLIRQAEKGMAQIREFNRKIPLLDILRLLSRNMNYRPNSIGGGEDWFALYKQFWNRRIHDKIKLFTEEVKRKKLIQDAAALIRKSKISPLDHYQSGLWGSDSRVRFEVSTSFIKAFLKEIFFAEMNPPLKLILIDGQFYKQQNRQDFNDCYSGLLKNSEDIKLLDYDLSPQGALGKDIVTKLQEQKGGSKADRKAVKSIQEKADNAAEKIVTAFLDNIKLLMNVINGIIRGEKGGRYDTISNLGYIGKSENKNLLTRLGEINSKLDTVKKTVLELYDIEQGMKF